MADEKLSARDSGVESVSDGKERATYLAHSIQLGTFACVLTRRSFANFAHLMTLSRYQPETQQPLQEEDHELKYRQLALTKPIVSTHRHTKFQRRQIKVPGKMVMGCGVAHDSTRSD